MNKHVVLSLILILSLGAVTACGQQNIPSSKQNQSSQTSNNTQTAMPGERASNQGFASAPIVAPPSFDDRPPQPGEMPRSETLPNGLPALKPLKGVNVDTLFAENITNDERRFERLENAVIDMRREFEAVKPAIVRLVAVEEDIQQMVEQLEAMAMQETSASPAPVYREPAPTTPVAQPQNLQPIDLQAPQTSSVAPQQQATEPKPTPAPPPPAVNTAQNTSGPMVKNLRTGRHSNKIRLVLDMSSKTPYTVDLDSEENILLIELPQAGWSGARSKTYSSKEPLLASYNVESINSGAGTRIIIALKGPTAILERDLLPPGVTPNYRVYIDLKR